MISIGDPSFRLDTTSDVVITPAPGGYVDPRTSASYDPSLAPGPKRDADRERVRAMMASGASLEDIARAGGKTPVMRETLEFHPENLKKPAVWIGLAGGVAGGLVVAVAVRQAGGNNMAQGLGVAVGFMLGHFAARSFGGA
jgi:hypothetical protein